MINPPFLLLQSVRAGLGRSRSGRSLTMRVRTDGVQITWLPEEEVPGVR